MRYITLHFFFFNKIKFINKFIRNKIHHEYLFNFKEIKIIIHSIFKIKILDVESLS